MPNVWALILRTPKFTRSPILDDVDDTLFARLTWARNKFVHVLRLRTYRTIKQTCVPLGPDTKIVANTFFPLVGVK